MTWHEKLLNKWGLSNKLDLVLVIIVFGVTGSSSVKLARPILELIGVNLTNFSPWLYWTLRILIIFPVYQLLLIVFAAIVGLFRKPVFTFFLGMEVKMLRRFGMLRKPKQSDTN